MTLDIEGAAATVLAAAKSVAPTLDFSEAEVPLRCGYPWLAIANTLVWLSGAGIPLPTNVRRLCEELAMQAKGVEAEMIDHALSSIPIAKDLATSAA